LEGNLCFAECAPELPGCPRASSSIAGCHLLTVKRLSVAEPRGAGISCCVSVSVVLLRQLVVPRMGWGWRSFATTSLWLLIFMILLFNGSFVGLHCECEYVSGFQFLIAASISFLASPMCVLFYFIFSVACHRRQFGGMSVGPISLLGVWLFQFIYLFAGCHFSGPTC